MSGITNIYNNLYSQQKQQFIRQRYDEIYNHELAHKSAAGQYGGSIVIEKDSNGIPIGGHVSIAMPMLDTKDPDKTIKHANTVINAAMAPSDPSSQDYKVVAEAQAVLNMAKTLKNQQKLNYFA